MAAEAIIEVRELTRKFGAFVAVNRVSFAVQKGEIFGYLGANGAGKSTTIRMLCGLLLPTDGEAMVAGVDARRDPEGVKRAIGYMSQRFSLYLDLTVEENLEFFGGAYRLSGARLRGRIATMLAEVGLEENRGAITGALPGGYRQRLALACAMLHEPQILFLDEPTAGVDPTSRRGFWRQIRALATAGTTIFVTTHYMDEAEYCDRVGLMVDGQLAALDTPAGLKKQHVPGRMLQIKDASAAAMAAVRAMPGVIRLDPFGAGFHLRSRDDGPGLEEVRARLTQHGAGTAWVETIEPTLEDVFLQVVGQDQGGRD